MTTLRSQLATIQLKATNELDLKAQKAAHAKSLLFDPKFAANQSLDVIYQLCYEGFEELCALDSRFMLFEKNIFSQQSKTEDRLQMTEKENEELDMVLESFLGLVGARLMLKPAVKAVEWLIRRFRVLESNTECLVFTFLPYHATPTFTTLLSILPKQLPPTLKFLHPYMAQLSSPPRRVIVFTATQNTGFFNAINHYVLNAAKAQYTYHILLSFWASIVAQTINDMLETSSSGRQVIQRRQEEDVLTRVLPVLAEGLGIRNVPELVLGCYMLIAVLVSKATLSDRTLDELTIAVGKSLTPDTIEAALGCVAVIAEQRAGITMPDSVLKVIFKIQNLPERLEQLAPQQSVQKLSLYLMQGLLSHIIEKGKPLDLSNLERFLTCSILDSSQRASFIQEAHKIIHNHRNVGNGITNGAALVAAKRESNTDALLSFLEAQQEVNSSQNEPMNDRMEIDISESNDLITAEDSSALPALMHIQQDSLVAQSSGTSFLAPGSQSTFEVLRTAFEQVLQNQSILHEFLAQPVFQSLEAVGDLTFFSFFLRVGVTSGSRFAKCCALRLVTERMTESRQGIYDLQAMLPYVLFALGDISTDVRRAAGNLAAELNRHLLLETSTNSSEQNSTWSRSLYGSSNLEVKWLSSKTAGSLVNKVLLTALEECISDAHHLSRVIQNGLDGSTHSKAEGIELHRNRLKATQRSEVFAYLCNQVEFITLYSVKLRLLSMLNLVDRVGSNPRSKFLLPCAVQLATVGEEEYTSGCIKEHVRDVDLTAQTLQIIHPDDPDAMDFLLRLTDDDNTTPRRDLQIAAFQRLHDLWPQLKRSKQKKIAEDLLEASLQGKYGANVSTRRDQSLGILRSVIIPVEVLVTLLDKATRAISQQDHIPTSKRRRTIAGAATVAEARDVEDNSENVGRLTLVLELIEGSRGEADSSIMYSLFEVLRIIQHQRAYTTSDLAYLQNLTLGSLSKIIKKMDRSPQQLKVDESSVRVDLLVDCVRNTTSIQARNLALLLLAGLTRYTPKAVLDSIMPIFTLMSATTMQQSDEFSAHVVDQTIQQVVPLLSQTLREQKQDLAVATAEILLSFAAAFEHIAPHRRLQLYFKLASSLGASESLFAMLATLFDRFPGNAEVGRFSVTLFTQFTTNECLITITRYLDLLLDRTQPKPTLARVLLRDDHGHNQQTSSLTDLTSAIVNIVKDSTFRTKLSQDMKIEEQATEIRSLFSIALEQTIRLSQATREERLSRTTCTQLLECLLSLLPLEQLIQSVQPLLATTEQEVTRSILKTLELRIKTSKNVDRSAKAATQLLPHLTRMIRDETRASLRPNVLICVDRICEKFGKTDPTATFEAVEIISGEHCVRSSNEVLRMLSLHCLASSVEILRNDFIPLLQKSVPAAIQSLKTSLAMPDNSVKLHNAAYAFFMALVDHVPFMISRATLRTILEISQGSASAQTNQKVLSNRTQFLNLASTRLDFKMLLDVSSDAWSKAVQQGPMALQENVETLKAAIENHSKTIISQNTRTLFQVLLQVLDIRRMCVDVKQLYSEKQLENMESAIISLVISVVLKINDTLFRPFFSQILEWSSSALAKRDSVGKTLRSITVFNLITALSERLKSIFTVYFGYILDHVSEVLKSNEPDDVAVRTLKMSVMRALSSSFKYDQDDFWQAPAHFDIILEPLVAQLSIQPASQVTADVIPAITEFATAAASNDHHKDLNRFLLKSLKANNPRVRLSAVKCQESLARRLGDEWLGHLPEMLPVINELQDDDDDGVERETHKWIKLIEDTLGESLNSMLQ